ncbi:hypothetical protein B0O99DRAFT_688566 [Bisporella sp. PMI_857]|nr:hypothetical protein B0O99DRAFT_688566 [Bisporella sp. PMI_857]
MSDNENPSTAASGEAIEGMPAADVKFLIACLQNTTAGAISVDTVKVATELGYSNHRSVGNKVLALKKKYGLPFGTGAGKKGGDGTATPKKASDAAGPNDPAIPGTPSTNKVAKKRAPAKKAAAPKTPKPTKGKKGQNANGDDATEETFAVKTPIAEKKSEAKDPGSDDEAVFGKADSDEDAMEET